MEMVARLQYQIMQFFIIAWSKRVTISMRLFGVFFQLIVVKFYASYLHSEELGHLYLLFTISYVLNAALLVPIDLLLQPIALEYWKRCKSLSAVWRAHLHIILFFICCALILEFSFSYYDFGYFGYTTLLVVLALTQYWIGFARKYLNNINKEAVSVFISILDPAARATTLLITAYYGKINALFALLSAVLALILVSIIIIFWFFKKGLLQYHQEAKDFKVMGLTKGIYHFSISGITNLLQLQGYRLILVPMGFSSEVGIFALMTQFGSTATASAGTVFTQMLQPSVYANHFENFSKYIKSIYGFIFAVLISVALLAPFIAYYFTRPEYIKYSPLIIVGVLCEGANLLIGGYGIRAAISQNTKGTAKASIYGLIYFLILFAFLIFSEILNVWSIGIPLVTAQYVTVIYMRRYYA